MEESISRAIEAIKTRESDYDLREILTQFYQERSVELLEHLAKMGDILTDDLKIGGTD